MRPSGSSARAIRMPAMDSALTNWAGLVTHPEPVTATVREVTGTPARTFRQWAADHAGDFLPPSAAG